MGWIQMAAYSQEALSKERNKNQRHIDHPQLQPLIAETALSSQARRREGKRTKDDTLWLCCS